MAVPRTHDGSVGPRSRSSLLVVLAAVFAVVVVASAVVLGVRYADTEGSTGDRLDQLFSGDAGAAAATADDVETRELVMSQANQFLLRINTYGPGDLDEQDKMPGYAERVREVITPKFAVDFDKNLTLAEQSVAQAGLARTAELYATGTESLEGNAASVLVAGAITQSVPDPEKEGRIEYEPLQFRYQVTLLRIEDQWLVDDFVPVTGEVEEPPGGATEPSSPYADIVDKRQGGVRDAIAAVAACGFPQPAGAADRAACVDAAGALGGSARTLANSLQGAGNPDSQVYVGEAPPDIAELVAATRAAATDAADAAGALTPACVTGAGRGCADRRAAVADAGATLTEALDAWEPYL